MVTSYLCLDASDFAMAIDSMYPMIAHDTAVEKTLLVWPKSSLSIEPIECSQIDGISPTMSLLVTVALHGEKKHPLNMGRLPPRAMASAQVISGADGRSQPNCFFFFCS